MRCADRFMPSLFLWMMAALLGPLAAGAQPDTVRVGDGVVDGSFIRPYTITWQSFKTSPDGETTAGNTVEETVEFVEGTSGLLLKFAQAWYNPEGALLYVNTQVADPKTLAQRKFHSLAPSGGIGHIDVEGTRLQGVAAYTPEGERLLFDHELAEPIFADGLAGLLLATFPLRNGYEAAFPGFGWGGSCPEPCLSWMQFRVIDREQMEVQGVGLVDTWVVELGQQPGSGLRYWVTKEAPYFVKAVAPSANGGTSTFEILTWTATADER